VGSALSLDGKEIPVSRSEEGNLQRSSSKKPHFLSEQKDLPTMLPKKRPSPTRGKEEGSSLLPPVDEIRRENLSSIRGRRRGGSGLTVQEGGRNLPGEEKASGLNTKSKGKRKKSNTKKRTSIEGTKTRTLQSKKTEDEAHYRLKKEGGKDSYRLMGKGRTVTRRKSLSPIAQGRIEDLWCRKGERGEKGKVR